jgi:hypothetical protein
MAAARTIDTAARYSEKVEIVYQCANRLIPAPDALPSLTLPKKAKGSSALHAKPHIQGVDYKSKPPRPDSGLSASAVWAINQVVTLLIGAKKWRIGAERMIDTDGVISPRTLPNLRAALSGLELPDKFLEPREDLQDTTINCVRELTVTIEYDRTPPPDNRADIYVEINPFEALNAYVDRQYARSFREYSQEAAQRSPISPPPKLPSYSWLHPTKPKPPNEPTTSLSSPGYPTLPANVITRIVGTIHHKSLMEMP